MKKLLLALLLTSPVLLSTTGFAVGFKVCLFHDTEYAYIPQFNICPWNSHNLPPDVDENFPPGNHHNTHGGITNTGKKAETIMTDFIHSPECFGEHNGGMN